MSDTITYRIDIDGTIAEPKFYHEDLRQCGTWYVQKGIITDDELAQFRNHHQLFLHPQILLTHQPFANAIAILQQLAEAGNTLAYFTVRQSFQPNVCAQIHANTKIWLEQYQFPLPHAVQFFWSPGEKLLKALEAPEEQICLIDDRVEGLLTAYQQIKEKDPISAQQIQERILLVAFGHEHLVPKHSGDLRVVPLHEWSLFFMQEGETSWLQHHPRNTSRPS